MPELTDDQLDGLFRKSGGEFDTPFDPAAWQDMKARLDANDRTTPSGAFVWKNLLRWGLPVALLMLLIGGGWFVYRKVNSGTTTTSSQKVVESRTDENTIAKGVPQSETPRLAETQQPIETPVSSPEHKANEVGTSANRTESAKESGNEIVKSDKEPDSEVGKPGSKPNSLETKLLKAKVAKSTEITGSGKTALANTSPKTIVATKSIPSSYKLASGRNRTKRMQSGLEPGMATNSESTTSRLSGVSTSKSKLGSVRKLRKQRNVNRDLAVLSATDYAGSSAPQFTKRQRLMTNGHEVAQPDGAIAATVNAILQESNETTSALFSSVNELMIRPAHWPKSLAFTGRPVEAQPDTTAQRVVPKPPVQRGFSVRFVVSPDLSSVGLKNFSRPGTNVGLLLEYRFASRWSIQAGVIKSTKVYKALASEYEVPSGWWSMGAPPTTVDGRCNMFDIPINIRYDVAVIPRLDGRLPSRWFVSGGVTSYIMKQEDYHYTYSSYYHGQVTDPPSTSTGGYGFSNLNLSVGYERSFSRRLSWQIEPFMKMPLKGVGQFKVDLLSTGAFFSLRYKL